ncbi:hypothetical protein Avbf_07797 [Armadillidium vulgare]|nr:hypothetical protein Avbf_07797 [Armadillidium vulgare]
MSEVYKAMKVLNFEWKVMNPYYVKVRRKNPITGNHVYMSLQLYQVDYKSHLLDFKVISSDHSEKTGDTTPDFVLLFKTNHLETEFSGLLGYKFSSRSENVFLTTDCYLSPQKGLLVRLLEGGCNGCKALSREISYELVSCAA